MKCPLCLNFRTNLYFSGHRKEGRQLWPQIYHQCLNCSYIFLRPELRLDLAEEKARYLQHQNDPDQEGYCRFLNRLWQPVRSHLKEDAKGLDYGCGPTTVLAKLARQDGFHMDLYDPLFHPHNERPERGYDFLLCSEAFEHFFFPHEEVSRWKSLLAEKAVVGVMTEICDSQIDFANWYYRRDPTHVGFLTPNTIQWIAQNWNWQAQVIDSRVILFLQNESLSPN